MNWNIEKVLWQEFQSSLKFSFCKFLVMYLIVSLFVNCNKIDIFHGVHRLVLSLYSQPFSMEHGIGVNRQITAKTDVIYMYITVQSNFTLPLIFVCFFCYLVLWFLPILTCKVISWQLDYLTGVPLYFCSSEWLLTPHLFFYFLVT